MVSIHGSVTPQQPSRIQERLWIRHPETSLWPCLSRSAVALLSNLLSRRASRLSARLLYRGWSQAAGQDLRDRASTLATSNAARCPRPSGWGLSRPAAPATHHHGQAQHTMQTPHPEIDQDDHRGKWQPIAEDGEGPCITGIACEDQAADRTAFQVGPPGKQPPLAAVRAALAQSAPKRRADQFRAGRRHTQVCVSNRPLLLIRSRRPRFTRIAA